MALNTLGERSIGRSVGNVVGCAHNSASLIECASLGVGGKKAKGKRDAQKEHNMIR